MSDLISRSALKEHKFVGNKYVQIGGRTNGKTLENINKAYQQGWNDAIDAIIDNSPTVNEDMLAEDVIKTHENIGYEKGFRDGYAQCITDKEERIEKGGEEE